MYILNRFPVDGAVEVGFGIEIEEVGDGTLGGGFADAVSHDDAGFLVEVSVIEFSGDIGVLAD